MLYLVLVRGWELKWVLAASKWENRDEKGALSTDATRSVMRCTQLPATHPQFSLSPCAIHDKKQVAATQDYLQLVLLSPSITLLIRPQKSSKWVVSK